jgi:hypothetical protein
MRLLLLRFWWVTTSFICVVVVAVIVGGWERGGSVVVRLAAKPRGRPSPARAPRAREEEAAAASIFIPSLLLLPSRLPIFQSTERISQLQQQPVEQVNNNNNNLSDRKSYRTIIQFNVNVLYHIYFSQIDYPCHCHNIIYIYIYIYF